MINNKNKRLVLIFLIVSIISLFFFLFIKYMLPPELPSRVPLGAGVNSFNLELLKGEYIVSLFTEEDDGIKEILYTDKVEINILVNEEPYKLYPKKILTVEQDISDVKIRINAKGNNPKFFTLARIK